MKSGSVTVDLAAESGGNIETTVKDEKVITDNGVKCLGYTDLASRLPTTSSTLYSNNISKFLLSMGPQTTKIKDYFYIDHEDPATRGMLTVEKGKLMWPAPAPPAPPAPAKKDEKAAEPEVIDYRAPYVQGAKQAGYLAGSVLAVGCISPDPAFSSMFTTFALSNIIGVQVVLGVTHALHSPLMAVSGCICISVFVGISCCGINIGLLFIFLIGDKRDLGDNSSWRIASSSSQQLCWSNCSWRCSDYTIHSKYCW